MFKGIANAAHHSDETVTPWRPTVLRQVVWLIGCITVCLAVAGVGAAATATSVNGWYQTLNKPSWNPPDWLFGPVWTTLFVMMGVAAWLAWRRDGWLSARTAMIWFGIQLALNMLWSVLFFGLQSPGLAFAEILVLWMAIVATVLAICERTVGGALLLTPYLAWTTFAAVLNFTIWRLN